MTPDRRMTVIVAIACVLTSTVLYPLFKGVHWFYVGIGAVIVVAACGTLSRLRTLPVVACLGISILGLLLYLNLVFEARHSLLAVIPTPASVTRLWELAQAGMTDATKYAPPAPAVPGLVLLAVSGIGVTAALADLIAVRLRSTALAGLPLLVLFTVPITMKAPSGPGTIIVFSLAATGYLAMLSADGREQIRLWGRLVSLWRSGPQDDAAARRRKAEPEPGPDTRALAAAGRRVGLASVVLALCIPLIVPGLHPSKLFSSGPGIGGSGGTAPTLALPGTLSQIQRELQESHPTQVLTYTISPATDDPPYLREVVYDNLTDSGWQASDYATAASQVTSPLPPAQGLADAASYSQATITVHVDNDSLTGSSVPTFLPVAYPPVRVTTPPGIWLSNPELMVFSQADSLPVSSYTVTSRVVDPTSGQLNSEPPPTGLAADLQLPPSYEQNAALRQIANEHTKGDTTEWAKVNALATWLSRPPFRYSATSGFDTAAGLLEFLTQIRTGVCVQYAYALTVLARLVGIPARLAAGFTQGSPTSSGHYAVTTDDAHAWTEVYFTGYGWIQFEATPPGGDGTAHANQYQTQPPGSNAGGGTPTSPVTQPSSASNPGTFGGGLAAKHPLPEGGGGSATTTLPAGSSSGTPWGAVALAVIAAIALACGVIAIVAPPAQRVLSFHPAESRRRQPTGLTTGVLVVAVAAILGLVCYRLLGNTSGLGLRADWATVGITFGAACAVVLVAPAAIRFGLRRWRWMAAADDASRAHTAWREFRDDLADLGVGCRPSEPPRTLAGRITTGLREPARDAIRRLALAEERATYSARPTVTANLRRDGTVARRGLAASVGRGARWRARVFPASVMTALAAGAARIPDRVAAVLSRRWTMRRSAS